jgi:hypothetical protein
MDLFFVFDIDAYRMACSTLSRFDALVNSF